LPNARRKLVLVVVDSMRCDMLLRATESGDAPTFRRLIERGELVADCVSSFPSVTPVCTSEIMTGSRPDRHLIPGMNWFHRAEQRYVEYGSSFEATRAFGLFRSLYDTVYNLNMGHLNFETLTLFERLADAGLRTAGTPFLIYRGRTRHEVGLEGLLRAFANAAKFHHAVWGPEELFYGELYSSRKVDAKPTLARPATRDAFTAAAGRILAADDLYDFLLYSLPDTDYYAHRDGPDAMEEAIALADDALAELVAACGGMERFLSDNGVIVVSDHAQSQVERPLDLAAVLGRRWQVLQPNAEVAPGDALAVGPCGRAAGVWILAGESDPARRESVAADVRAHLELEVEGVDLVAWIDRDAGPSGEGVAYVRGAGIELAFHPDPDPSARVRDRRGVGWSLAGDPAAVGGGVDRGILLTEEYPDALSRLWAALRNPNAADVIVSLAAGWECVDWGGTTHIPGGSHGSLLAVDSLGTLLTVGLDGERPEREQWAISDVYELIERHFGLDPTPA